MSFPRMHWTAVRQAVLAVCQSKPSWMVMVQYYQRKQLVKIKHAPQLFQSKTVSSSQKRYPVHRVKFLGLKLSIREKFSHW